MKLRLLTFESRAPAWVGAGRGEYTNKLNAFTPFELRLLKSPSAGREQADVKRRREAEALLKEIDPRDELVLFDEAGALAKDSRVFADRLGRLLESGKARLVFAIGGPYGLTDEVRARASARWSLSPLTMNHWVAQITALEQIYRGFTILRGIPYHN